MDFKKTITLKGYSLLRGQAQHETRGHMNEMIDSFLLKMELNSLFTAHTTTIRIRDREGIVPSKKNEISFQEMGGAILQTAYYLGYLDLVEARERTWTLSEKGRNRISNHPSIVDFKLLLLKASNDG
jgi:hypothetical protein